MLKKVLVNLGIFWYDLNGSDIAQFVAVNEVSNMRESVGHEKEEGSYISKYAKSTTEFTDGDLLVDALSSLGYAVEYNTRPIPLNGWLDNSEAEIILRKTNLSGAHADIGFRLNVKTGRYDVLADEDDMRNYGYGREWLNKVKVSYREKQTIQMATQRLGLRFVDSRHREDGKIEMEFLKV